jgi:hypothetical protein
LRQGPNHTGESTWLLFELTTARRVRCVAQSSRSWVSHCWAHRRSPRPRPPRSRNSKRASPNSRKSYSSFWRKKKATPAPAAAGAAGAAGAAAAPKPEAKVIQANSITPNAASGTSFLFTGYAKVDGLWTDTPDGEIAEGTSGRDYYVPSATPIGGVDEGTDFDSHAKQTRLIFGTDTPLDGGDKVSTRFEVDFFGSSLGDQRVTNTYAPVLRHAYVQWREWLAGQTWTNFQDIATLPDSVDFIGPTDGTVFVRQPQVRYTKGGFSASLENPETTITPYVGTLPPTSTGNDRITTDDSVLPDFTARYTWKGSWGHFSVAGLARELKYEQPSASFKANIWTAAGSLSGKFVLGKDDIRYMLLGGNLGRLRGIEFHQRRRDHPGRGSRIDRRIRGIRGLSSRLERQAAQQPVLRDAGL